MRVLVIDDDDVMRARIVEFLRGSGHTVHELMSAIGATRLIFRHNIEAVVVDVVLPGMNGDKLARSLRQNKRGASLWIILVSGRPIDELKKLGAQANADGVVSKSALETGLRDAFAGSAKAAAEPDA